MALGEDLREVLELNQLTLAFPETPANEKRFWQRRYYDFNLYSEKKLREKLDYMHGNPVKRAGWRVIREIGRGAVGCFMRKERES